MWFGSSDPPVSVSFRLLGFWMENCLLTLFLLLKPKIVHLIFLYWFVWLEDRHSSESRGPSPPLFCPSLSISTSLDLEGVL